MQIGKTTYGARGSRRYGRRRLGASVTHCQRNHPLRFLPRGLVRLWSAGSSLASRINNETTVARTPLLQFLRTLAYDVRHCEARDISVSELMAERLAAPSRRQFVAGAAAMAGSAALPEAALAA